MADGGTILIVDDETTNIEILAELLASDYDVIFATSGEEALAIVESARPDLILLDVMMPDIDGYEVCARLKKSASSKDISVIFITGLGDLEAETRGLSLGAVDYVTKPINPAVVRMRVRNHIELKIARDELARLAATDGLTGLANRRRFDQVLATECSRLRRSKGRLSLIMIDIDHFKAFNDTYGHVAGDGCLRQVGGAIGSVIHRTPDLAARYGGEEFSCILPELKSWRGSPRSTSLTADRAQRKSSPRAWA
jgi:PleD family two-component response regulator